MSALKGYIKSHGAGTCLNGYLHATYAELVAVLGKPHEVNVISSNSHVEWCFRHCKTCIEINIYDDMMSVKRDVNDVPYWRIGTQNQYSNEAMDLIHLLFPNSRIMLWNGTMMYSSKQIT